jgi:hypothetical protein
MQFRGTAASIFLIMAVVITGSTVFAQQNEMGQTELVLLTMLAMTIRALWVACGKAIVTPITSGMRAGITSA